MPFVFVPFVIAAIAMSVMCTWLYNNTGGSLFIVVLFHAASNLPITVLISPLGSQMSHPFLIYVVLMVVAAVAVVIVTGPEHCPAPPTNRSSSPDLPARPLSARGPGQTITRFGSVRLWPSLGSGHAGLSRLV